MDSGDGGGDEVEREVEREVGGGLRKRPWERLGRGSGGRGERKKWSVIFYVLYFIFSLNLCFELILLLPVCDTFFFSKSLLFWEYEEK